MTRIVLLTTAIVTGLVAANSAVAFGGPQGAVEHPAFSAVDTNGDGKISTEELQAFPALNAAERFKAADTDGDGKISKEELATSVDGMKANRATQRLDNMIARFDTDKDGAISQAEMEAGMGLGRAQRTPGERMLEFADTDNDGMISEEEYNAMENRMQARMGRDGRQGKGGHGQRGGGRDGGFPFWRN